MRRAVVVLSLCCVATGSLIPTDAGAQTDTLAPVLHALSAEPTRVSVYSGPAIATVYATVTEDLSGVMHADSVCGDICYPTGVGIYSPSGGHHGFGFVHHVGGDLFAIRFRFSEYGERDTWEVRHLQLTDNAGNTHEQFESDLDGAGFSATVEVTDDPPVDHVRSASLALTGHLFATGAVTSEDGSAACRVATAVTIQKRTPTGSWRPVSSGVTRGSGAFKVKIPDKTGAYKAMVASSLNEAGTDRCMGAESSVVRHRHK